MKNSELIDKAAKKVGGVRELGRQLDWNHGTIAKAKKTGKLNPEKAIDLALIAGESPEAAYLEALRAQEISEKERAILGKLLRSFKAGIATLTIAATLTTTAFYPNPAYAEAEYKNDPLYTICFKYFIRGFVNWRKSLRRRYVVRFLGWRFRSRPEAKAEGKRRSRTQRTAQPMVAC